MLRGVHKHTVRESRGLFADLNVSETAICLAPIKRDLLEHFPELLAKPDLNINSSTINQGDGVETIQWRFSLKGENDTKLEACWRAKMLYSKDFRVSSISLWPPQVSDDWNFYVLHGQGQDTETTSVWRLVD